MGSCVSSKKSIQKLEPRLFPANGERAIIEMKNQVLIYKIRNCPKLSLTDNEMYLQRKLSKVEKIEYTIESRPATR